MAEQIPDLWRGHEDDLHLYPLYLVRLFMNGLHEKVIAASRQIRRYATRGPGARAGLFTFSFEIDSLCARKQFDVAWRQLRKREAILFGKTLDLAHHRWSPKDSFDLPFYYAPLLYFRGQDRLGCALLETWLGFGVRGKKMKSYEMLAYVYKGDKEPWDRYGVTLKHFYNRLGMDLRQWRHWKEFVNGFPPRLFRLTEVNRADMLQDAALLPVFFDNLLAIQAEGTTTAAKWTLADLINQPTKTRTQKEKRQKQQVERNGRSLKHINEKLLQWFPDLKGLPS